MLILENLIDCDDNYKKGIGLDYGFPMHLCTFLAVEFETGISTTLVPYSLFQ